MGKRIDRELYLNATESAKLLHVSPATFHFWRRNKAYIDRFSPREIGSRTYYNASRLKEFKREYVPHSRLEKPVKSPVNIQNDEFGVTVDLILSVLVQLEKAIEGLKRVH